MPAPPSGCGCSSCRDPGGPPPPPSSDPSLLGSQVPPPLPVLREGDSLVGGGQRAWGGALLWLPASSGGQDACSSVPAVTAVATHPCWEVGPGGAGLFTVAPLVLTRSRGPVGITLQTRFRGPAAGLSDPPGKRWAGVTPEGLAASGSHPAPRGPCPRPPRLVAPALRKPGGDLGGCCPPAGLQAGLGHGGHAMPCPAPGGGHRGRAHSGPHSLLSPLLVWGVDPPWEQVPAGAPGSRRLSGGGRRTAPGSPWGLQRLEWPEWV